MDIALGQQLRHLASNHVGELARGNRPRQVVQHRWIHHPQGAPMLLRVDLLAIARQNANLCVNPNDLHTNLVAILML